MGPSTYGGQRVPGHVHIKEEASNRNNGMESDGASGKGLKRKTHCDQEECSNSCDCEDFGLPLAKKINQLNIEYSGRVQEQVGGGGQENVNSFREKYPYPEDSHYFSTNNLLNRMYVARVERKPELKHNPT